MALPIFEPHTGPVIERIGFLVHSLELLNHYGSVWDLLPENSFDVILQEEPTEQDLNTLSQWKCDVVSMDSILDSNTKYQYLVSNHPLSLGDHPLIKRLAETNIRFMYAAGKSGWNLLDWNNLYDLILCFGPYHASVFSDSTAAVTLQMGYPRFDKYFTEKIDLPTLLARYDCDPMKQTVVWLPTWKTLSSVGYFDKEISQLTDKYNVVVKLHPLMPESEPERVEELRKHAFTHLIVDSSNNLPLYQIADYMLFDYGGPPLAAVYTDKRMILLNVPDADKDDLTGKESPDILIRSDIVNVDAEEGAIERLLNDESNWQKQRDARRSIRKIYFAPYMGFSSIIAANALQNLNNILPERTKR